MANLTQQMIWLKEWNPEFLNKKLESKPTGPFWFFRQKWQPLPSHHLYVYESHSSSAKSNADFVRLLLNVILGMNRI